MATPSTWLVIKGLLFVVALTGCSAITNPPRAVEYDGGRHIVIVCLMASCEVELAEHVGVNDQKETSETDLQLVPL